MRKIVIIAHLLPVLLLLCLPLGVLAQSTGENDKTDDLKSQLEEKNEAVASQRSEVSEKQRAFNLAEDDFEATDQKLNRLTNDLEDLQNTLKRKQDRVKFLSENHKKAINDLSGAQERFEKRLVEWYKAGPASVLSSLVVSGDLFDFLFAMRYTEAIVESDNENINFIKEQQSKLFEEKEQLDIEVAETEKLIQEMREQEKEFERLRERRYTQLSALANDVKAARRALDEMEASSYEIQVLLQASIYTGSAGGALLKPLNVQVNSGFGMRRHPILGRVRMHTGWDLCAPYGTEIHAAGDGLVIFSGWKRGYGYTVIIDHGKGLGTLYGHCSSLLVNEGETVRRGQVIAKVGSTGLATGTHCHFEVRVHGEPKDPTPFVSGR